MRVLILGGTGMLGHALVESWRERFEVWATVRGSFEGVERWRIFDPARTIENVAAENFGSVVRAFGVARPQAVINCIGVIKQLKEAKDPIHTLNLNAILPHRLAALCGASDARFVTLSTDCVFSGTQGNYTERDAPDAADLYGQSKRWGEVAERENCLTVRTSIIGRELGTAHSLLDWFLSHRGGRVKGYTNAIFSGFPTVALADILADVLENHPNLSGLRHVSSEPINKYELLKLVNEAFDARVEIEPFNDFYCDRSLDSTLFRAETNFAPPDWAQMISALAVSGER